MCLKFVLCGTLEPFTSIGVTYSPSHKIVLKRDMGPASILRSDGEKV
jgi:hypothetical protein